MPEGPLSTVTSTPALISGGAIPAVHDDRPVLILVPATLIWQWQEELEDKLGIPAAVWTVDRNGARERRPL
jgi:hypothetical protein